MMRIALVLATNFAVMMVFGIICSLFNIQGVGQLLVYAALFGFVGSFISIFMSKSMAKRSMGVQIIEQPSNDTERWIMGVVTQQAEKLGIGVPEVGIFNSPQPNAFATGWNKNDALVAVSVGLLQHMDRDEVEAVIGHEMAHVNNGDMVTLGLIQGVVNTFVIVISRLIAQAVSRGGDSRGIYFMCVMVCQAVFGVLATGIVAWFSRYREFHADAGGAELAGREHMISALERLKQVHDPEPLEGEFAAFGISGGKMAQFFATHPPLDKRIEALRNASV